VQQQSPFGDFAMSHYPVDINYFLVPAISGRMELDLSDLDVEGEVPAQLDGAFFRMQPDRTSRTTDEDVTSMAMAGGPLRLLEWQQGL
jgi:hypothetical protein